MGNGAGIYRTRQRRRGGKLVEHPAPQAIGILRDGQKRHLSQEAEGPRRRKTKIASQFSCRLLIGRGRRALLIVRLDFGSHVNVI